jgi:hypothetical protein
MVFIMEPSAQQELTYSTQKIRQCTGMHDALGWMSGGMTGNEAVVLPQELCIAAVLVGGPANNSKVILQVPQLLLHMLLLSCQLLRARPQIVGQGLRMLPARLQQLYAICP